MAIDPGSIKLASPIESTAADNTAVYSEQVYSSAGVPFDQLIDAKTTFNTTNAVYLSARGSDATTVDISPLWGVSLAWHGARRAAEERKRATRIVMLGAD